MSFALLVGGWTYNQSQNINLALTLVLVSISLPLFENHVLIAGYAELPLGVGVTAATILLALALDCRSRKLILAAALVLITPLFIKNTGIAYASAPALAFAIVWIAGAYPEKLWIAAILVIAGGIYIGTCGWVLDTDKSRLGFEVSQNTIFFWEENHLN